MFFQKSQLRIFSNLIRICLISLAWNSAYALPVAYPLLNPSFESPELGDGATIFPGTTGWTTSGNSIGLLTMKSSASVPGQPAPDGGQFLYGAGDNWQVLQSAGTLQANTRYLLQVDLFPLPDGENRAEVIFEETDYWSTPIISTNYQPPWDPMGQDFQLPAGQWTTVTLAFNSAGFSESLGLGFRIRIRGSNLAVDNVRLTTDQQTRDFYIANSGSDATNSGLSEASPWKTFKNLASLMPLLPGERVLLKRGDVFTQELHLDGSGTAEAPIELTAYGSGANPIISRSNLSKDLCIVWEKPSYVRINQIDCRNAKMGIYLRYDYGMDDPAPQNFDVRIDRCNFKDMPDSTLKPETHHYEFAHSDAIFLGGHDWKSDPTYQIFYTFLDGLKITNCVAENCGHGFGTGWYYPAAYRSRLRNLVMEDNLALNCLNGWASLIGVDGGWMKRCHSRGGGGKDTWAGTTLGMIQTSQNFLIQDCEFSYCDRAQAADGCGMDFEGNTSNVTFDNNTIHHNDASAILILTADGPHHNLVISNNVLYNNARDPWNSEINSEIQGSQGAHTASSIINNSIYRADTSVNFYSPAANWSGFAISGNHLGIYTPTTRTWDFNQDANDEGWSAFSSHSVSLGKLRGTSVGDDPYVSSPALFIDPRATPYVWIRMKTSAGNTGQLFFVTAGDSGWNLEKSITFTTHPNGQFHDYFIDLRQQQSNEIITKIRVNPSNAAGLDVAIDFIRLTNQSVPSQTPPPPLPPALSESTFTSVAAEDGHVFESAKDSAVGGLVNNSSATFRIGDDPSNRGFRPVLSFDTSALPDNAVIIEATLGITRTGNNAGVIPIGVANNPFGAILVDVMTGSFSGNATLESSDWQAIPTKAAVSKFAWPAYSNPMKIYSRLEIPDLGLLNKLGKTQFRIRYEQDDDNDSAADFFSYASADNANEAHRPTLKIKYFTNRPPEFSATPYLASATVNVGFSGQLSASDPDGGTLNYSKIAGPAWLEISTNGALSGTPAADDSGPNSFTAQVTDPAGISAYTTLEIEVSATAAIDANANGIPDAWEIDKFGNAGMGNNASSDDADRDGLANLVEYALDTHPLQANANPIAFDFVTLGEHTHLRLSLPKNPAATHLSYLVEVSDNLQSGSWTAFDGEVVEDTATRMTVRDRLNLHTPPQRFLRLKVTSTNP